MSRNAISANPEHYIFKIFRGSMPLEGLKKSFSPPRGSKIFFRIDFPPKQKILDRTLAMVAYENYATNILETPAILELLVLGLLIKLSSPLIEVFKTVSFS